VPVSKDGSTDDELDAVSIDSEHSAEASSAHALTGAFPGFCIARLMNHVSKVRWPGCADPTRSGDFEWLTEAGFVI
jgi:hypothetical protein